MRVDQIKERFGDQVTVEWRSFLLRPEARDPDQEKFVEYTQSWLRPAEAEPRAQFQPWSTDNPQPSGSLPAQVAAKAVDEFAPDCSAPFRRRLMEAYFSENRDISDSEVHMDLAGDVGVDLDGFAAHLASRQRDLSRELIEEHNSAIEMGISAVPTIVLDGMFPVQGAQELATYEHWIRRLLYRRSS